MADANGVISVHDLDKTYRDGTRAVQRATFTVRRGEIFGLLGPNGAGKTTTMRIIGGLDQPTGGRVQVLGQDPARADSDFRHRIGFALQEVGLDDLATVEEMARFHARLYDMPRSTARKRADEMLDLFDLTDHRDKRVENLSGGMKRRLDLAVSLVHEPEVLLLDEPSTGLDPRGRRDLWRTIRRLRDEQGLTLLMSTHYMDEADALCDRVGIMHQGRVQAVDTPQALRRSVGADRIRVAVTEAPDDDQARRLQELFGGQARLRDGVVEVPAPDGPRYLLPALKRVTGVGLDVESTEVVTPTLDDVFLKYTGAHLQEGMA